MDILEEAEARTKGVNPAARRLQLGLSAIVGREDGAVVEMFPDGTEVVLHPPPEPDHDAGNRQSENEQGTRGSGQGGPLGPSGHPQ